VIDTRSVAAWAAGHIAGAVANPLRPQFASWLGWLVEPGRPVAFVVGADQDRSELVRQCHQIGYDHLVGELAGGMNAWNAAGRPATRTRLVTAAEVDGRILDVRKTASTPPATSPGRRTSNSASSRPPPATSAKWMP
jgi:hydroxyacylglutathione hydrolase